MTFAPPKDFVESSRYSQDRRDIQCALDLGSVDKPIVDLVSGLAALPHCFTLQSCYGHFVFTPEQDAQNLERIASGYVGIVRYRIAYIALCVENSPRGRAFRESLARVPEVAPGYVQFGSASWFWERWVNSYALQVEPIAHQYEDEVDLEAGEALETQRARDLVFTRLRELLFAELGEHSAG